MRVVTVDQKGPIVSGYFVLATEIHDDSGSPHTLEHLCFLGSRNYQYKGFLDKLASRAYSDTNAWTAIDHTAYTLESAGWDGFAQILPVYLEHLFSPTLTHEGYYTEVYHVDGAGHDAGVVYSEVQGIQNTSSELMDLECRRLLYPDGIGFRQDTKGLMEQLRVLTAERIRAFHREMYQPRNLCLVITGEVDHDNLLRILDGFEDTILDIIPDPKSEFKRPWIDSVQAPELQKSVVKTVHFPESDESFGEIEIRFLGPDCRDPLLSKLFTPPCGLKRANADGV
jgi:Zn-dependent M16 (insulinase) family peptidase